jgi:hypothetical protein
LELGHAAVPEGAEHSDDVEPLIYPPPESVRELTSCKKKEYLWGIVQTVRAAKRKITLANWSA